MTDEQRDQLLKDEYLQLEQAVEDFDGRALTIKAWSITFSQAALVGAFASHSPAVLLIASLAGCLFWLIEVMWKTFQYAFYERINQIEDYFAGKRTDIVPLQIGRAWYARWSKLGSARVFRIMTWPHVMLPHVIIILLGVVLFLLYLAGVLTV